MSRDHFQSDVGSFVRALSTDKPGLALSFYGADFLNGFHLMEVPEFGFWVENRRNQLKDMAIRAAQDLAHRAEGERDLSEALFWWHRALELSPYHEGFIRRIISLLAGSGNRGKAITEFEAFQHRSETELELPPSLDTLELVRKAAQGLTDQFTMWIGDRRSESRRPSYTLGRRSTDR